MENTKDWVLHPNRCQHCHHSTHIRDCWSNGLSKIGRHQRLESNPNLVSKQEIQFGDGFDSRGVTTTFLSSGGGISYTVRGHGVTVTISGHKNDVFNIARVADDVVTNSIITGEVCIRRSDPTPMSSGAILPQNQE
nr:MAG: putative silencing suppressor protein [Tombusviridae sp.]